MHAMHEMQPIVTGVRGVCPSVCLSRGSTRLHSAKTAELIKMLLGVNTPGGRRNVLLEGVLIPHRWGRENDSKMDHKGLNGKIDIALQPNGLNCA